MELRKAFHKKYDYTLHKKLLNFLIRKGKKEAVRKIIAASIYELTAGLKLPTSASILWTIFKELYSGVEVRLVRKKGRHHFVPFNISYYRQTYLIIKWIQEGLKTNKERVPLKQKVQAELRSIYSKTSESKKNKRNNDALVFLHKSNNLNV
jgi:ribosomal protein S7